MTWAQRLKRVFNIDIETCEQCVGTVKVIASIEHPLVIQKILSHLNTKNDDVVELLPPQSRAPPQISLFERKPFIIISKTGLHNSGSACFEF
jgi:hypothetical protein